MLRDIVKGLRARGFPDASSVVSIRLLELVGRSPSFIALVRDHPEQVPIAQVRKWTHQRGIDRARRRRCAGEAAAAQAHFQNQQEEAVEMMGMEDLQAYVEPALAAYVAKSGDPDAETTIALFRRVTADGVTQSAAAEEFGLTKRTAQRRLAAVKQFAAKWIRAACGETRP